jgi:uncharacterized protein (TIGR02453 family)
MPKELRFTPQFFDFLRELKANNNREWFEPNKPRYLIDVRDPVQAFIVAMGPRLRQISPQLVADPKRSMFRIYRDVRFSKNKTPYKTNASCFFFHQAMGKEGTGVYLNLEPERCYLGIGAWRPDPVTRTKITDAIAAKPELWREAVKGTEFRKVFTLEGEQMAKLPKRYDSDHEFAEDLKRKDFVAVANFTEKQACAKDFLDRVDHNAKVAGPFLGFLIKAIGLKW